MSGYLLDAASPASFAIIGIGLIVILVVGILLIGLCVFLIVHNVRKSNKKKAAMQETMQAESGEESRE